MVLIGKKIKDLRKKFKYTQTELANIVGVTKSTIAAYENDSRLPSYDVLIKMAGVFKVSIDSLLLNRYETILDVQGLTVEQLNTLECIISDFRKSNLVDTLCKDYPIEMREVLKKYSDQ